MKLAYDFSARPTLFSLFMANMLPPGRLRGRGCDVGTGGGILAIAMAQLGMEEVIAFDRSAAACEVAEINVRTNGVANRVRVEHADVHDVTLPSNFDLIVCNPPTLPSADGVPPLADGGGSGGLDFLDTMLARLPEWLATDGATRLVVSSLTDPERLLGDHLDVMLDATPLASMLAPFRSFYDLAYDKAQREAFLDEGFAIEDEVGHALHELLTVYELTHSLSGDAAYEARTKSASPRAIP